MEKNNAEKVLANVENGLAKLIELEEAYTSYYRAAETKADKDAYHIALNRIRHKMNVLHRALYDTF